MSEVLEVKRIRCGYCKELHGSAYSVKDCGDQKYQRGIYRRETERDYWEAKAQADREYADWEMIDSFQRDGFI